MIVALRRAAAAAALLAFAIYASWPALPHFGDFLYGDDQMISAWGWWWVSESLFELRNPWYTDSLLAPEGTYLSFHALIPLAGVVLTPLIQTIGAPETLNVMKLMLPVAAVYTGSALAREAGLAGAAAWTSGVTFGFSVVLMWRTDLHQNFGFALPLLPIGVLFAMRYARTGARRDALLAGGGAGLVMLSDPTIAIFTLLAIALWVGVAVASERSWRRWISGSGLMAVTFLVVSSPQLWMMHRAVDSGAYEANNEALASTWIGTNTNLQTMFSPMPVREWFPGNLERLWYTSPETIGEATPVFGWGAVGLAIVLVVALVARRATVPMRHTAFAWATGLFVISVVLALGPEMTVAKDPWVPLPLERYGQQVSAVMPYTWLTYLPFFGDVRVPSRFTMLGIVPLSILAGGGMALLLRRRAGYALAAVMAVVFVAECGFPDGGGPNGKWTVIEREELYEPVRADRGNSIVVDVPVGFLGGTEGIGRTPSVWEPMLRAIEHGHRIAGGYVTRLRAETAMAMAAKPFYAALLARQDPPPDGASAPPPADLSAALDARAMQVGWVVLWPQADRQVVPFLRNSGFTKVRESQDGVELWKVGPLPPEAAALAG